VAARRIRSGARRLGRTLAAIAWRAGQAVGGPMAWEDGEPMAWEDGVAMAWEGAPAAPALAWEDGALAVWEDGVAIGW
jgi:hypothetical protein